MNAKSDVKQNFLLPQLNQNFFEVAVVTFKKNFHLFVVALFSI